MSPRKPTLRKATRTVLPSKVPSDKGPPRCVQVSPIA